MDLSAPATVWPLEITLDRARQQLTLRFDDDTQIALSAEYLRVESPSAEVQGHGTGQRVTVSGKRHVRIAGLEPVGHYALRILFDDGHDTGIYTWRYFQALAIEEAQRWPAYLTALAAEGLVR